MERIWTMQTEEAWNSFQKNGVLHADGRRVWSEFRRAYQWMMEQMRERLPDYRGHYPLWAWVRWSPHSPRPDLRASSHLQHGERGVRMELLVPSDSMLPHDFEAWHIVLANGLVAWSEGEDDKWEQRERSKALTPRQIQREKEKSWLRIFDLMNDARDSEWCCTPHDMAIAAVLERIMLDQVQKVDHFIAR